MGINSLTESYLSIKDELRTAECFAGCASLGFTTKPRDAKLHVTKQQCTVRFTDFFWAKAISTIPFTKIICAWKMGNPKYDFSARLCQPRFCNFKATPSGLRYQKIFGLPLQRLQIMYFKKIKTLQLTGSINHIFNLKWIWAVYVNTATWICQNLHSFKFYNSHNIQQTSYAYTYDKFSNWQIKWFVWQLLSYLHHYLYIWLIMIQMGHCTVQK